MGKSIAWFVLGLALAACGGTSKNQDSPPGGADSCTPGARTCEGLNVKLCGADGKTQTIDSTCAATETCSEGLCSAPACLPGSRSCTGSEIYECDSTGSVTVLAETCTVDEFCLEDDEDAECGDVACQAGEPMCDGARATTCKADGSGPKPGGTDCAEVGQICYQGSCRDQACSPGQKLCTDGDVYLCSGSGTSSSLLVECSTGQVCDGQLVACRAKVCEPAKVACDGSKVVVCNEWGSEKLAPSQDCADSMQACVNGECKPKVCTPNAQSCQNNDVYSCDSYGTTLTLSQACTPGVTHCESYYYSSAAYCVSNECPSGEQVCHDSLLKTCTEEGTFPATGADCGAGNFCDPDRNSCQPKECEPGTTYCHDGNVYYCYGFSEGEVQQTCISGTSCRVSGDVCSCVPFACSPTEASCLGNKVGVCAATGASLSSVTTDCTTSNDVCTVSGVCAASAVDTMGIAEDATTVGGGNLIGNAIDVHSARKLTSIEVNLVLVSSRELRFVVYELAGTVWTARIDHIVPNQQGTTFFSSGPLNYTLQAGKRYLFAVAVTGGNYIAYYDAAPYRLAQSFGTVLGAMSTSYSATLSNDYLYQDVLYQIRVTTALP